MLRRGRRDILYYMFPLGPDVRSCEALASAVSVRNAIQLILAIPLRPIHMAKSRWDIKAYASRPVQCTKRLSINSFERPGGKQGLAEPASMLNPAPRVYWSPVRGPGE